MSRTASIALVLDGRDVAAFRCDRLDMILIAPGIAVEEQVVVAATGCEARNLNRFASAGAIVPASRVTARLIRALIDAIDTPPVEAIASQNDLYQYHLRMQFYTLQSLEAALRALQPTELVLATPAYRRYWSPMRPAQGLLHSEARTLATLVAALAQDLGIDVRWTGAGAGIRRRLPVWPQALVRRCMIAGFRTMMMVRKTASARASAITAGPDARPVVMVVRTDSEVLSAKPIADALRTRGIPCVFVHDEILSSRTTLARLKLLGEPSIAIGALRGWRGLSRAWRRFPRSRRSARPILFNGDGSAACRTISQDRVVRQMTDRLFDFAFDQRHFHDELAAYVRQAGGRALVTFAYVDQWGPVIADVAKAAGIACIAIQNAAQDPEEYPRLCWSDRYCVEGTDLRERLVALGYPPDRIVATGLPRFRNAMNDAPQDAVRRAAHRTLVVLTQPIYETYFDMILLTSAEFVRRNGWRLCVKLHPRQPADSYAATLAAIADGIDLTVEQQRPLEQILDEASLTVSVVSAAMISSIFQAVPLCSLLPIEENHLDLSYVEHPVTHVARSAEELQKILNDFDSEYAGLHSRFMADRSDYMTRCAKIAPGPDATENVVLAILEMLP